MPTLCFAVEELCPLLVAGSLKEFAERQDQLNEGDFGVDVVHSLTAAALERVYTVGMSAKCESDDAAMLVEEPVWEAMVKEGKILRCVPPDRQMDALHALQVFWHDKGMPKGRFFFVPLLYVDLPS